MDLGTRHRCIFFFALSFCPAKRSEGIANRQLPCSLHYVTHPLTCRLPAHSPSYYLSTSVFPLACIFWKQISSATPFPPTHPASFLQHLFLEMSNPAALVRRVGEPSEYQLLREVLRRKLIKVSPALYPNITLDQILAANGNNNMYPYQE